MYGPFISHGGYRHHSGGDKGTHGRTDSRVHLPVDRREHGAYPVDFPMVEGPGAGGQEVPRPGMPGLIEIVEFDHRKTTTRGHSPVSRINPPTAGHHRCQSRSVVVIIPGSGRQGEIVRHIVPADNLVPLEQRPAAVRGKPIARVPHPRRGPIQVVIRKITQIAMCGVTARIQNGNSGGPVVPKLPPAGFESGRARQKAAVRQGRHAITVNHDTSARAVFEESPQA